MVDVFDQVFHVLTGSSGRAACTAGWTCCRALCFSGPTQIWQIPCHLVHEPDQPSYTWNVLMPEVREAVRQFLSLRKRHTFNTLRGKSIFILFMGHMRALLPSGENFSCNLVPAVSCPEVQSVQHVQLSKIIYRTTSRMSPGSPKIVPNSFQITLFWHNFWIGGGVRRA